MNPSRGTASINSPEPNLINQYLAARKFGIFHLRNKAYGQFERASALLHVKENGWAPP